MDRLLLCANPAASGFTGGLHREVLSQLRAVYDVEAEWPKSPKDTRQISAAAAADGVATVVAMGGDGVVHHVANGITGTQTALGIIPAGTTNVFGRLIGIPTNPRKAADLLCSGISPRAVPTAHLRIDFGGNRVAHRLATFATGVGLDAEVIEVAEQEPFRKYRFGAVHYARTTATVVRRNFAHRQPLLEVSSGERKAKAVAVLVQLHRHYTYFGRLSMRLGPNTPGTLTALIAKELTSLKTIALFAGTATRMDLNRLEGIEVWHDVTSIEVGIGGAKIPVQADGEILGKPQAFTADVRPSDLLVLAPSP